MGLLFSSCSDWLDVTPVDTRTTENFLYDPVANGASVDRSI